MTTIDATSIDITVGSTACTSACKAISADAMEVLTDEDTEADAIVRVLADNPWGDWLTGTSSNCTSSWEVRTSGFSFTYIEAEFRYHATGLMPSTMYTLTLDVYQSVYGMGMFTMIGTISSMFMTDAMGNYTISGSVPIAHGYDTYVTNPVVT